MKTGFYKNHSFKAQNIGGTAFQGAVDFANGNTANTLDTGFGYANAAVGVFNQYTQGSKFVEGSMLYDNVEAYVQDNWKVNSRLTIDWASASRTSSRSTTSSSRCRTSSPNSGIRQRRRCSTCRAAATAQSPAPATSGTRGTR